MLDYVYGHDRLVADFVADLIPHCHGRRLSGACKTLGVINEHGELIAGIVWHNWDPEAGVIEISGAAIPGSRWLTPETLKRMYQYPFLQIGCQMIIQRNDAADERLLRILAAYNYSFIRLPRMLGRNKDMVLAYLTREAWEANKFCRRYQHHLEDLRAQEAA